MSSWVVEYSPSQKCLHLEEEATIQKVGGDWREIARLDCSVTEANDWCREWEKQHIKRPSGVPKGTFCHPDDRSIPIGKRKVEFVKWLMRKGEDNRTARLICSRRFWKEEHGR